jgi:nucleotide-binding universal stress UspA family protein
MAVEEGSMSDIRKILFPVDLSEASPKIVPWVISVAQKYGAQVDCLFVARDFEHFSMAGLVPYADTGEFHDQIVKNAEKLLARFVTDYFRGVPASPVVASGYPAEMILEYAREHKADLIVMGTHGRKGVERIIFGSVAEHVVKNSIIPVMTVKPI